MRIALLCLIGYSWGSFAAWYIGTESLTVVNWTFSFIVIPGAIGILFAKTERLLSKK